MNLGTNETQQTQVLRTPKAMTVRKFHAAIGGIIGLNSLYALVHSGKLRHIRVRSKILVLASEVEDFFTREGGMN